MAFSRARSEGNAQNVATRCILSSSEEGFLRKAFENYPSARGRPGGLAFYTEILSTGIPRESVAQACMRVTNIVPEAANTR